jgi:hypothetical protein
MNPRLGRLGSRQAFNIDVPPRKNRNDPREQAREVFGKNGDGIFFIHR